MQEVVLTQLPPEDEPRPHQNVGSPGRQTPGYRGTLDRRPRNSNVQHANLLLLLLLLLLLAFTTVMVSFAANLVSHRQMPPLDSSSDCVEESHVLRLRVCLQFQIKKKMYGISFRVF
jgi:hypothetical protein